MAVKCTNCGGAHPSWDCSKPTKSTAARKDVLDRDTEVRLARPPHRPQGAQRQSKQVDVAGTQALPVDTLPKPKMGRPRTGYIKAEYNRLYSADKRKADKLGLKVSEYRKMKGSE